MKSGSLFLDRSLFDGYEKSTMNRSLQPPDQAAPEMDICSISESVFLSFLDFG